MIFKKINFQEMCLFAHFLICCKVKFVFCGMFLRFLRC
nr:MAG TPA: hypothetical protein [Caudoviricetes sp.]